MATTYTSTINVNVWKEHTCTGCGTVYRYLFKRTKTGQGGTPEAAEAAAHNAVVKALGDEVDMQPCPGCGLYQADMIANRRSGRHWWVFWLFLPIVALLFILVLADVLSFEMAGLGLATATGVYAFFHLLIDFSNPNSNLDANHRLAVQREEAGDLWVPNERKSSEPGESIGSGVGAGHFVCYLMLIVAVLGFLLPAGLRVGLGMKTNPKWHPEVVGPGEESYVWFDNNSTITSVKSLWSGQARVTVLNAAELGLPPSATQFTATTKNSTWGNSISVKSSEKNSRSRVWARVRLPADTNLIGKTVRLQITVLARYPAIMGANSWREQTGTFQHTGTLQVSSLGSGSLYRTAWWGSFVVGILLTTLSGILLAVFSSQFRRKALPTSIFIPEDQRLPEEDDEDDARDDRDDARDDRDDRRDRGPRYDDRDEDRYRR